MKRRWWLTFAISLAGASSLVEANTDEIIASVVQSGTPFSVTLRDDDGGSRRKPGIYAADDVGKWKLIVDGEVLRHPLRGPVLDQLTIAGITDRHEMIAVVDGRPIIFSFLTKRDDPETILAPGSQNLPVYEVGKEKVIQIPTVSQASNTSVYHADYYIGTKRYALVLFSMKVEGYSPVGSGVTFYLILDPHNDEREKDESKLLTKGRAQVLDYSFRSRRELSKLVLQKNGKPYGLVSEIQLHTLAAQNPDDTPAVLEWRKGFLAEAERLSDGQNPSEKVPYYSLLDDKLVVPSLPKQTQRVGRTLLLQHYDPVTGIDRAELKTSESKHEFQGRLNFLPETTEFAAYAGGSSHLFYLNDRLMLGSNYLNNPIALDSPQLKEFQFPDEISVYTPAIQLEKSEKNSRSSSHSYAFLSAKKGDQTASFFYEIERGSNEIPGRVTRFVPFSDRFYTEEELHYRTKVVGGGIYFDHSTPRKETASAYGQAYKKTAPHIDLLASETSGKVAIKYLEPLRTVKIAEGITYNIYDDKDAQAPGTGLYLDKEFIPEKKSGTPEEKSNKESKSDELLIDGELLSLDTNSQENEDGDEQNKKKRKRKGKKKEKDHLLLSRKINVGGLNIQMTVVAIDRAVTGGDEQFTMLVMYTPLPGAKRKFRPQFVPLQITAPFSTLTGLQAIQGIRKSDRYLSVLASFDNPTAEQMDQLEYWYDEGIYALGATINVFDSREGKDFNVEAHPEFNHLDGEALSSEEILERVGVVAGLGSPALLMTPELDANNEGFSFIDLSDYSEMVVTPRSDSPHFRYFSEIFQESEDGTGDYSFFKTPATWKVFSQQSSDALKEVAKTVNDYPRGVFKDLEIALESAADPNIAPKHRVIVVPDTLKPFIRGSIFARWVQSSFEPTKWNHRSKRLELFLYGNKDHEGHMDQSTLEENFEAMRKVQNGKRAVLFTDLETLNRQPRPDVGSQSEGFFLEEVIAEKNPDAEALVGDGRKSSKRKIRPHALYTIACEGRRVPLSDFEQSPPEKKVSVVMLATESEWNEAMKHSGEEGNYGLDSHFEKLELTVPDRETRKALVLGIFNRPEVLNMHYRYDASQVRPQEEGEPALTNAQAKEVLAEFIVSRVDREANRSGQHRFTSFLKYLGQLSESCIADTHLRRSKVIDLPYLEGIMNRVFSIPLNLHTLREDDPLKVLSRSDAPILLQQAGYEGPIDLKTQIIKILLSQTRNDPVRPVPSSMFLFGETGTGKTHLFRSLLRMLRLKEYDYQKPDQPADAIIIRGGKIVMKKEEAQGYSDMMTLEEAMQHLDNFLAAPQGARGWILFDDLHDAPKEVRGRLMARIRGFFESDDGMYEAKRMGQSTIVRYPARNLNLFVTANPTNDLEKLRRFAFSNKHTPEEAAILAALSEEGMVVEDSFLKRFASIINLSKFPPEAKGPKLVENLAGQSRDQFNFFKQTILMAPTAVKMVVEEFKQEDARTFLSSATQELTRVADSPEDNEVIHIVVPKIFDDDDKTSTLGSWKSGTGASIEAFIQERMQAISVSRSYRGKMELLNLMLDAYRTMVIELFVESLGMDERFAGTVHLQQTLLAPVMHASYRHLSSLPSMPLDEVKLSRAHLDASAGSRHKELDEALALFSGGAHKHFPIPIGGKEDSKDIFDQLLGSLETTSTDEKARTRRELLHRSSNQILARLKQHLAETFWMDPESVSTGAQFEFPDTKDWLTSLEPGETARQSRIKALGADLGNILYQLAQDFYAESLVEIKNPGDYEPVNNYDVTRLFLFALDYAIARMPWAETLNFMTDALEKATKDQVLGQSPGVQEFLFKNSFSILSPRTKDFALQMLEASPTFKKILRTNEERLNERFEMDCENMLELKEVAADE